MGGYIEAWPDIRASIKRHARVLGYVRLNQQGAGKGALDRFDLTDDEIDKWLQTPMPDVYDDEDVFATEEEVLDEGMFDAMGEQENILDEEARADTGEPIYVDATKGLPIVRKKKIRDDEGKDLGSEIVEREPKDGDQPSPYGVGARIEAVRRWLHTWINHKVDPGESGLFRLWLYAPGGAATWSSHVISIKAAGIAETTHAMDNIQAVLEMDQMAAPEGIAHYEHEGIVEESQQVPAAPTVTNELARMVPGQHAAVAKPKHVKATEKDIDDVLAGFVTPRGMNNTMMAQHVATVVALQRAARNTVLLQGNMVKEANRMALNQARQMEKALGSAREHISYLIESAGEMHLAKAAAEADAKQAMVKQQVRSDMGTQLIDQGASVVKGLIQGKMNQGMHAQQLQAQLMAGGQLPPGPGQHPPPSNGQTGQSSHAGARASADSQSMSRGVPPEAYGSGYNPGGNGAAHQPAQEGINPEGGYGDIPETPIGAYDEAQEPEAGNSAAPDTGDLQAWLEANPDVARGLQDGSVRRFLSQQGAPDMLVTMAQGMDGALGDVLPEQQSAAGSPEGGFDPNAPLFDDGASDIDYTELPDGSAELPQSNDSPERAIPSQDSDTED